MNSQPNDRNHSGSDLVTLELPGRDLGEFLTSVLGQRRTVSKEFEYYFEIDVNWVLNFIELISQRVYSQNGGKIISLHSELSFKDGKKIELFNLDQLRTFTDVSSDISTSVILRFIFLIKYPYKDTPERQDITFIATTREIDKHSAKPDKNLAFLRNFIIPLAADKSQLTLEIKHTDLSWGEDIINLVSNHIESSFQRRGSFLDILRVGLALCVPIAAMAMGAYVVSLAGERKRLASAEFLQKYSQIFEKNSANLRSLEEKVNIIYQYLSINSGRIFDVLPFMLGVILPGVAIILGLSLSRMGPSSYVILNSATQKHVSSRKKQKKIIITTLFAGIILSIITGLASSSIYDHLPVILSK